MVCVLCVLTGVSQVALLSLLVKVSHADINLVNRDGYTCVMVAAIMGNATILDVSADMVYICCSGKSRFAYY